MGTRSAHASIYDQIVFQIRSAREWHILIGYDAVAFVPTDEMKRILA